MAMFCALNDARLEREWCTRNFTDRHCGDGARAHMHWRWHFCPPRSFIYTTAQLRKSERCMLAHELTSAGITGAPHALR